MDCTIIIRDFKNASELSDVPEEKIKMNSFASLEMRQHRLKKVRWILLRYPGPAIAQLAAGSAETGPTDFGGRSGSVTPGWPRLSLCRYAAQQYAAFCAVDGNFPPGPGKPHRHERPPGQQRRVPRP